MTPMTPFVESPTGRLTELVYLLSDRPLPLVHEAVLQAQAEIEASEEIVQNDPWLVVATALQRLSTMSDEPEAQCRPRRRARRMRRNRDVVLV